MVTELKYTKPDGTKVYGSPSENVTVPAGSTAAPGSSGGSSTTPASSSSSGQTWVSRDKSKSYYGQEVTVVNGKITPVSPTAKTSPMVMTVAEQAGLSYAQQGYNVTSTAEGVIAEKNGSKIIITPEGTVKTPTTTQKQTTPNYFSKERGNVVFGTPTQQTPTTRAVVTPTTTQKQTTPNYFSKQRGSVVFGEPKQKWQWSAPKPEPEKPRNKLVARYVSKLPGPLQKIANAQLNVFSNINKWQEAANPRTLPGEKESIGTKLKMVWGVYYNILPFTPDKNTFAIGSFRDKPINRIGQAFAPQNLGDVALAGLALTNPGSLITSAASKTKVGMATAKVLSKTPRVIQWTASQVPKIAIFLGVQKLATEAYKISKIDKTTRRYVDSPIMKDLYKAGLSKAGTSSQEILQANAEIDAFQKYRDNDLRAELRQAAIKAGYTDPTEIESIINQYETQAYKDAIRNYYKETYPNKTNAEIDGLVNKVEKGTKTDILTVGIPYTQQRASVRDLATGVSLFFMNKQTYLKGVEKELEKKGVPENERAIYKKAAWEYLQAQATGEAASYLSIGMMSERLGRANFLRISDKLAKEGAIITEKQIFPKLFKAGFKATFSAGVQEGYQSVIAQNLARKEPIKIKDVIIGGAIGGVTAGAISGTVIGTQIKHPLLSGGINTVFNIIDPFEYPSDKLADLTYSIQKNVWKQPIRTPGIFVSDIKGMTVNFGGIKAKAPDITPKSTINIFQNIMNQNVRVKSPTTTNIFSSSQESKGKRTGPLANFDVSPKVPTPVNPFALVPVSTKTSVTEKTSDKTFNLIGPRSQTNIDTIIYILPKVPTPVNPFVPVPVDTKTNTKTDTNTKINPLTNVNVNPLVSIPVTPITPIWRLPPPLPLGGLAGSTYGGGGREGRGESKRFVNELEIGLGILTNSLGKTNKRLKPTVLNKILKKKKKR